MKILKPRLILLCLGTVLTLGLSHAAAQSSCNQIEAGGTIYGNYDCRLKNSCGAWCNYECTCTNLRQGHSCDDVLKQAGFELGTSLDCLVV
jgi:hypothetical protein